MNKLKDNLKDFVEKIPEDPIGLSDNSFMKIVFWGVIGMIIILLISNIIILF